MVDVSGKSAIVSLLHMLLKWFPRTSVSSSLCAYLSIVYVDPKSKTIPYARNKDRIHAIIVSLEPICCIRFVLSKIEIQYWQ